MSETGGRRRAEPPFLLPSEYPEPPVNAGKQKEPMFPAVGTDSSLTSIPNKIT